MIYLNTIQINLINLMTTTRSWKWMRVFSKISFNEKTSIYMNLKNVKTNLKFSISPIRHWFPFHAIKMNGDLLNELSYKSILLCGNFSLCCAGFILFQFLRGWKHGLWGSVLYAHCSFELWVSGKQLRWTGVGPENFFGSSKLYCTGCIVFLTFLFEEESWKLMSSKFLLVRYKVDEV